MTQISDITKIVRTTQVAYAGFLKQAATLDEHVKLVHQELEVKAKEIEEQRIAFDLRQSEFEQRARSAQDKIRLNVGGTYFTTTRDTLLVPGSYFEAMLGNHTWKPDPVDTAYFIDRDPTHFARILHRLRTGVFNLSGLQDDDIEDMKMELDYFLLPFPVEPKPSLKPTPNLGIFRDCPIETFASWNRIYYQEYSHKTKLSDIQAAKGMGTYIAVGAHKKNSKVLQLVGVGTTNNALNMTRQDVTTQDGTVYWYCCDPRSFGFADRRDVALEQADTTEGELRLSWHLTNQPGYRIGNVTIADSSTDQKEWFKVIFVSN